MAADFYVLPRVTSILLLLMHRSAPCNISATKIRCISVKTNSHLLFGACQRIFICRSLAFLEFFPESSCATNDGIYVTYVVGEVAMRTA
jgi:hypothetical protein